MPGANPDLNLLGGRIMAIDYNAKLDIQEAGKMHSPDTSILFGNHQYFSNWIFNPAPEISEEEIAAEIETRLNIFGLPRHLIEMSKEGTIYLNEMGKHTFLEGEPLELAKQLEKDYDVKIYYVYHEKTISSLDEGWRFFFIDHDKKYWEYDHVDLLVGDPMCFKYRMNQGQKCIYAEPIGNGKEHIGLYWKGLKPYENGR